MSTGILLGEVKFSRPAVRLVGRVLELTKKGVSLQLPALPAGSSAALMGACGYLAVADKRGIYSGEVRVSSIENSTINLTAVAEIVGNDRRASNRRKIDLPIAYRFVRDGSAAGGWTEARLSDVSTGGMKAHFGDCPDSDTLVDIRFSLAASEERAKSGDIIRAMGRILNTSPGSAGDFTANIAFTVISQSDRLRVHRFTRDDGSD